MTGLGWYKHRCVSFNHFCRRYVARAIAEIAGGDSGQYLLRAGKMIAKAKKLGQIECADGSKNYYRFVDLKGGSEAMRAAERTHVQPGASQSRQSHAPHPQSRQQG